ncbi:MAG: hypothetical protein K9J21_07030 [Bacteroidales bacterium]|nr:hypothetical protein [Bacteroidales bacterium]
MDNTKFEKQSEKLVKKLAETFENAASNPNDISEMEMIRAYLQNVEILSKALYEAYLSGIRSASEKKSKFNTPFKNN